MSNHLYDLNAASVGGWQVWPFELVLIAALSGLILADREAWHRNPVLTGVAALVFFAGMHPALDEMARRTVWLHSLQSLLIHHVGPLLLILANVDPCRVMSGSAKAFRSTPAVLLVLSSFTAMTLMWLSPALHVSVMESSTLYSLMKWAMALSGILLCTVVSGVRREVSGDILHILAFNFAIAAPQALAGLYLVVQPPLYPMPGCTNAQTSWLPVLDAVEDQRLGGALLIAASATFFIGDAIRGLRWAAKAATAALGTRTKFRWPRSPARTELKQSI